jgi:hypothetical protein
MNRTVVAWILLIALFSGAILVAFVFDGNRPEEGEKAATSTTSLDTPVFTTTKPTEVTESIIPTEDVLIDQDEWFVTDENITQFPEDNALTTMPEYEVGVVFDPNFVEEWGEEAAYIAKTVWGEARGVSSYEQERVIWCILNRVDDPRFDDNIIDVITAPEQFHGYSSHSPCTDQMYIMALDVIYRWQLEKQGGESNRNLGPEYVYFRADKSGLGNVFRTHW